jgi:hypothetical protein
MSDTKIEVTPAITEPESGVKMNPVAKAEWLKALRSGEYEQAEGKLCRPAGYEGKPNDTFCCLGVLTDVAIKLGAVQLDTEDCRYARTYTDPAGETCDESYLPPVVQVWAGLDSSNPSVTYKTSDGEVSGDLLANLNDMASMDFPEIADLVEANF